MRTFLVEQEKRKRTSVSAKQNIHPHHLGQDSYARAIPKWIDQKRLDPPSSSDSSQQPIRVAQRALVWKLGHEKRAEDGSWVIDPTRADTQDVCAKIVSVIAFI